MTARSDLPPWPDTAPAHGGAVLRRPRTADAEMARELATDPYVPLIGTLPAHASSDEAIAWVERQRARYDDGAGFSFTIVERATGAAVGSCGLWLRELADGRASIGYSLVPSARGRGLATDALLALTAFAWTVPALHRVELRIEPGNTGSLAVAERAGYVREGVLRSHEEIGGRRVDMVILAVVRPSGPGPGHARHRTRSDPYPG
ncbi:GNAT family N-acetyltransferase [Georgenia sp. Z1491]|uniref:GNAT family N-acetyltransferase n=1 Tax=Georgenia sp. Z1491 TaxID=3416707 RepID=UPI003CF9E750